MPFYTSAPNEAMVVSGLFHRRPKLVSGGRVWVWPMVQKVQRISLNLLTVNVSSPKIYTKLGVPISVTATAQVKIEGKKQEMLHNACQQFLGKTDREILQVVIETLEGHQRAIMGTMTVEEIFQDRQKFSVAVFEVSSRDLVNMGINVISYTIRDVSDDQGYLAALGVRRTAEVQRDAIIGEVEARRDAGINEARANETKQVNKFHNEAKVARAQRDFELNKSTNEIEVQAKKAESDLAYDLQAAKTKQKIRNEQMGIKVVEREKSIQVMEQEVVRREKELEATVKRPAQAEKYRIETLAEANKTKQIMEAAAEAEAIRAKGEAEAFAIRAKAQADAEAMAKKAEAWREYKDAAVLDMLLKVLPRIAEEVTAPLVAAKPRITLVAGADGNLGLARITGEVLDIVTKLPAAVHQLTGVDVAQSMRVSTA